MKKWQIFSKICAPICKGIATSCAILVFMDYWNMVEQPLILLSDDQLHPLSVFLSKINSGEISLAFAVAVIYMVLPMMVFLYGEEYLTPQKDPKTEEIEEPKPKQRMVLSKKEEEVIKLLRLFEKEERAEVHDLIGKIYNLKREKLRAKKK